MMDAFSMEVSIFGLEPPMSDVVKFPTSIAAPAEQPLPENFADHPVSVSAQRATNEDDGALQTPRDVLTNKLRQIDSGEIDPYCIVVMYGMKNEEGVWTGFETGGGDTHSVLGVATRGLHKMLTGQDA